MSDWPAIVGALGEGWLGKVVAAGIAGTVAWFSRRPVEKAAILDMVNKRMQTIWEHQEAWINHVTAAHEKCEKRCDTLEAEVDMLRGEVRQGKQIIESLRNVKT